MLTVAGIGLLAAFGAGLASFLSPCVFPLIPGYLAYLTGTTGQTTRSSADRAATGEHRWRAARHALCFVLGFTAIFVALGAGATALGATLLRHHTVLRQVAGAVIIVFGLILVLSPFVPAVPAVAWIYRERRAEVRASQASMMRSALVGVAFGAGWTPCIGPLLGSVLTLAMDSASVGQGMLLLSVYALGLGAPFVLAGLLIDRLTGSLRWLNRYTGPLNIGSGAVLIVMGSLMASGALTALAHLSFLSA